VSQKGGQVVEYEIRRFESDTILGTFGRFDQVVLDASTYTGGTNTQT
jgi:hypothetical protein